MSNKQIRALNSNYRWSTWVNIRDINKIIVYDEQYIAVEISEIMTREQFEEYKRKLLDK